MITALIIDDELHCITSLLHDLRMFCPEITIAATCQNAEDGIRAIELHRPDLVFLDIDMPRVNGFELLERVHDGIDFKVIFVTAYDQYILQALRTNALDYLMKPVDSGDLLKAVARAAKQISDTLSNDGRIQNLLEQLQNPKASQRIVFAERNGYEFVDPNDISYCKADGAYTQVVLTDSREILLSKSLGEIEQVLPTDIFARIHHSAIVNTLQIKNLNKSEGYVVVMANGHTLSIARSKRESFLQRMGINK